MITGQAIAVLGISPEILEDMSLREYFHALQICVSYRRSQSRELHNVARMQAWLTGYAQRVKELPQSPEKLIQFVWEEEEKKQSPEEHKKFLLSFAKTHNERLKKQKKLKTTPPVKMTRTKNTK